MRAHEFVTEKKKRRRKKSRWAAYGPGPYGMYGWNTGYSGDGGVAGGDGGAVGEGWKDVVAGAALATGVALGSPAQAHTVKPGDTAYSIAKTAGVNVADLAKANKLDKTFTIKPGQKLVIPKKVKPTTQSTNKKIEPKPLAQPIKKKIDPSKTLTGTTHEAFLTAEAKRAGIKDPTELAALLSQAAHESHDFKSMVEYGGSLDFRKYDIRFNPRKARELGNTRPGDGARYKGRGYIQLTGKYNYKRAGQALGLDLVNKPELAATPEVASKIAVWFWKQRVQPNVDNFNDVKSVTRPINPGLKGLEDRKEAFIDFKNFKLAQR
jgi:predicted chitinase